MECIEAIGFLHQHAEKHGDIRRDHILIDRVANLKKIYPYIPESLNRVLMHFSKGANWFYENTTQLLDDLREFKTLT
jgi:hypothetical protein